MTALLFVDTNVLRLAAARDLQDGTVFGGVTVRSLVTLAVGEPKAIAEPAS